MVVEIPDVITAELSRYGPRFIMIKPAIPGVSKSGKAPVEAEWQLHPMEPDDPKLLNHLKAGGNYGLLLGDMVVALDLDHMDLFDLLAEAGLTDTLTVRTGSGEGVHLFYWSHINENAEIQVGDEEENAGNVQAVFKQVVGAGSKHYTGGTYMVINDTKLMGLKKEDLEAALAGSEYTIAWSHRRKRSEEEAEFETNLVGDKIPIGEIVDLTKLQGRGFGKWQGSHPVHGSGGGQNFSIDTEKNCWHCFRHGTGGGPLSWLLVQNGDIKCEEARPGKVRGELFKKAMTIAKVKGFKLSDVKVPIDFDIGFDLEKGVKLQDALDTVAENFPGLEMAVETMLSVVVLNWFKLNKPFCLVLTGVSGSGKTTVMDMLVPYSEKTIRVDDITAASFVTQKGEKATDDELAEIDFLPKLEGRILITPEMSPMFSASEDTLRKTIGVLTRILDGAGYVRAAGTHGLRGYTKDVHFVWIGGTVPFSWRVWRVMSEAGPRMYFLGMPEKRPGTEDLVMARKLGDYKEKVMRCRKKVWSFLMELVEGKIIEWDVEGDDEEVMTLIANFAILLTRLRGQVIVKELGGGMYQHWSPRIELAYKPFHALYDIARGHAFLQGRTRINKADLAHAANIALNSAPDDRVRQFRIILESGIITNKILSTKLNCSISTAQRTTKELLILGLIEGTKGSGNRAGQFTLNSELKWFTTDEFAGIRDELGIKIEPSGVFKRTKMGPGPKEENWLKEGLDALDEG